MRILKYIFFLLILLAIGVCVFVATQKSEFEVTVTKTVKTPRNAVFGYVNELRNWEQWMDWNESGAAFDYPAFTSGQGGSFSWDGLTSEGRVKTISVKENQNIEQEMDNDGLASKFSWNFTDEKGATRISLTIRGKMGFMPKVYAALQGGPKAVMTDKYAQSLASLEKTINREINTFKIHVDGTVTRPGTFYLGQMITSTMANTPKNMRIMMSNVLYFFKKNKIAMNGKPFIMYDTFDTVRGITKFTVCAPMRDEVYTAPGSDMVSGRFETFTAVKTTLTGDYSHLPKAWDKTFEYIKKNNLSESDFGQYLEIYKIGKTDIKYPSKWVTEIYVPIKVVAEVTPSVTIRPAAPVAPPENEISLP